MDVCWWLPVCVGVHQGCVMSGCLMCIMCMDGVVDMNDMMLGRGVQEGG